MSYMVTGSNRRRLLQGLMLALDIFGIAISYWVASLIRFPGYGIVPIPTSVPLISAVILINIFALFLLALYRLEAYRPKWEQPIKAFGSALASAAVIVLFAYVVGTHEYANLLGRGILIGAQLLFGFWSAFSRLVIGRWVHTLEAKTLWLVIGSNEHIFGFYRDLCRNRLLGNFAYLSRDGAPIDLDSVGLGPVETAPLKAKRPPFNCAGSWSELSSVSKLKYSGVIACGGPQIGDSLVETLMELRLRGLRVYDLADFYESAWYKVPVFYLHHSWFALSRGFMLLHDPIGYRAKRVLDFTCALFLLILASPVLLLAALAIKLESPGSVIFKQVRVGKNGESFTVLKLRSMRSDAEKDGAKWAAKNDARVTKVGAFIRATRIDELPQLVNVLNGEMSFIGPRPERPEFTGLLEKEIPFYSLRHLLRPGVTGWAQVMYPYGASVEDAQQKLEYDLYYIKNYSLLLDVAIILKTIRVVLFGKGR